MHDDQLIKALITARLNHQGRIDDGDALRIFLLPLAHLHVLCGDDERVQDRIQLLAFHFIRKNDRSQLRSIQRAVRVQKASSKSLNARFQSQGAWRNNVSRRGIRIQNMTTQLGQHAQHERFANRNRSGESNLQHRSGSLSLWEGKYILDSPAELSILGSESNGADTPYDPWE